MRFIEPLLRDFPFPQIPKKPHYLGRITAANCCETYAFSVKNGAIAGNQLRRTSKTLIPGFIESVFRTYSMPDLL
jgi:hypothetical protein